MSPEALFWETWRRPDQGGRFLRGPPLFLLASNVPAAFGAFQLLRSNEGSLLARGIKRQRASWLFIRILTM